MNYGEDQDRPEEDIKETATEPGQDDESGPDDGFGDDFDDFEAVAGDDDFGNFNGGFQQTSGTPVEQERPEPQRPSVPVPESPFVSSYTLAIPTTYIRNHQPLNECQLIHPSS